MGSLLDVIKRIGEPSEDELDKVGISKSTYTENGFFLNKLGGLYYWNKFYSSFYFFSMGFGLVTALGFIYGARLEGDREVSYEGIHFVPLLINMAVHAAAYHYNQDGYVQVFRSIERGVIDYKGTLTENIEAEIEILRSDTKRRKKKFAFFYTCVLVFAHSGHLLKRPLDYLKNGRGIKPVDGENDLVWEGPFGVYLPYANHWPVYLFGMFWCYSCANLVAITAIRVVVTYQHFSEELLLQYAILEKTLNTCVERAETVYKSRANDLTLIRNPQGVKIEETLKFCLNLSLEHHIKILRMYTVFKDLMSLPLFMIVFDGGFILCITSYLIISDDVSSELKATMPGSLIAECTLLLIFCYYGERLSQANASIGDCVYESKNWAQYSRIIGPYSVTVKAFCNVPNELSAGGFSSVNHETFSAVLSTAYSYIGFMMST